MAQHNTLGSKGEHNALRYLMDKGYNILEQNYRFQRAEVDIIAKKEHFIVGIEVKTRSSKNFGNPQDFVKPKQIERLVKAMDAYMLSNSLDGEVRFDIIALLKDGASFKLEHLENAFYHF
jgi:putative endonuclease